METFARHLLDWYDSNRRDLPWRRTSDPYRIWVSEIMLQQTRVETVLPYYGRFLERFPDAVTLADADEDEVLSLWSGLGYYTRARNLHRGAAVVRDEHRGAFPSDPLEAARIPGIGPYTLAAVLSIAFGYPLAVVDGNVARVLARIYRIESPKDRSYKHLRGLANNLLEPHRAGDFNQAMMELGARICRPARPDCASCPVSQFCEARRLDEVDRYPRPRPRQAPVDLELDLYLLRDARDRLLLEKGRWGLIPHLWLPPIRERKHRPEQESELPRHREGAKGRSESTAASGRPGVPAPGQANGGSLGRLGQIRHAVTHHRIRFQVWSGRIARSVELLGPPSPSSGNPVAGRHGADRPETSRFREEELASIGRSSILTKALRLEAESDGKARDAGPDGKVRDAGPDGKAPSPEG